ncbi:TPA: hypothetical protein ACNVU4_002392, partial [Morganella morganii]
IIKLYFCGIIGDRGNLKNARNHSLIFLMISLLASGVYLRVENTRLSSPYLLLNLLNLLPEITVAIVRTTINRYWVVLGKGNVTVKYTQAAIDSFIFTSKNLVRYSKLS